MYTPVGAGTRDIPLRFAEKLTLIVQEEIANKSLIEKVTPITSELLKFWFDDVFCEMRNINFHQGQRQAILNTIYVHEILKTSSVFDMYTSVDEELLSQMDLVDLKKPKYQYPKFAVKMATGTGKTWVIEALLIWQYLNAKYETQPSGRYSKNFLLVAPGLIIYERLLNAFIGREDKEKKRNFDSSDFKQFESLFIPANYREDVLGFIQNATCNKDEISRKVTGEGLIAITNWHLLAGVEDEQEQKISPLEDPSGVAKAILPITPGTSAGHSLESLDSQYLKGNEIEYLAKLKDLVVINDEAHHIHENKVYGDVQEVEWQKSLNYIAEPKKKRFIQIDFSATPYDVSGSGQKRIKQYFPHVIVDFDLKTAIKLGLVKTIALDKRKEIASLPLDFRAERENGDVVRLSPGQKTMLRAGISKLKNLEKHFVEFTKDKEGISYKHPKMFVICEDTSVSPLVIDYLVKDEGFDEKDVIQIDSDKKGSIPDDEWQDIKQKLFDIDKQVNPKVIVSVLMLREGFDVNNICVIVPLRSSQAPILLEQTVGRGLRLMWREPEYQDVKDENRVRLLEKKQEPDNYMDILSIIEHPAFSEFYEDLLKELPVVRGDPKGKKDILGDLLNVGLKSNYKDYDIFFPNIVNDKEENLVPLELSIDQMASFDIYSLEQLKKMVPKGGDIFYSEEITVKTRFGDYEVKPDIFGSKSFNEFVANIVRSVSSVIVRVGTRKHKEFPVMQINQVEIAKAIDRFIRKKLFGMEFDPFSENNWRVLLLAQSGIVKHIIMQISTTIYKLQNSVSVTEAEVFKRYFSEVPVLKMREKYCLDITKTIYEKQSYPSNKGGLEKAFMEFCDTDTGVQAFIKVNENYHDFAKIAYVRADGMLTPYSPDFIVKTKDKVFIVETKAQDYLSVENVRLKQIATIDWVNRVNELKPEDRMQSQWEYVLLGEKTFHSLKDKGASVLEIFEYNKLTKNKVEGTLL